MVLSSLFTFALTIHKFTFRLKLFQCVDPLFILMLLTHVLYVLLAVIRKWENNLQNNIYSTIFLGFHRSESCTLNNNSSTKE